MTGTRTKDTRLRREARKAAVGRGHDMAPFRKLNLASGGKVWRAECRCCNAWVDVTPWPMPNDIEIGGPAVSLLCLSD